MKSLIVLGLLLLSILPVSAQSNSVVDSTTTTTTTVIQPAPPPTLAPVATPTPVPVQTLPNTGGNVWAYVTIGSALILFGLVARKVWVKN